MSQTILQTVKIWDFNDEEVEVSLFQLNQWKFALDLELKGIRVARKKVSTHVKKVLSCPRSFGVADMAAHITDSLDSINEQLTAQGLRS